MLASFDCFFQDFISSLFPFRANDIYSILGNSVFPLENFMCIFFLEYVHREKERIHKNIKFNKLGIIVECNGYV